MAAARGDATALRLGAIGKVSCETKASAGRRRASSHGATGIAEDERTQKSRPVRDGDRSSQLFPIEFTPS